VGGGIGCGGRVVRHGDPSSGKPAEPDGDRFQVGAKVDSHAHYVTFQMAEVLVSRSLFYEILERIKRLKPVLAG
jgi:hypothetical protein